MEETLKTLSEFCPRIWPLNKCVNFNAKKLEEKANFMKFCCVTSSSMSLHAEPEFVNLGAQESVSWNRFLGSINVYKFGLCIPVT
jgi:hypothetical protein